MTDQREAVEMDAATLAELVDVADRNQAEALRDCSSVTAWLASYTGQLARAVIALDEEVRRLRGEVRRLRGEAVGTKASEWKTRYEATEREVYERDIGPFRCNAWPDGQWAVYVAGKMPQWGNVDRGGDRIEAAKRCAVTYVEKLHAEMLSDLGRCAPPLLAAFDLAAFFDAKAAWSRETFGPGDRYAGVVKNIRKELDEILADPSDAVEWADVVLLAMDGAWRSAGQNGAAFVATLIEKDEKNRMRTWPDWRTLKPGEVSEHVKDAQPAPSSPGASEPSEADKDFAAAIRRGDHLNSKNVAAMGPKSTSGTITFDTFDDGHHHTCRDCPQPRVCEYHGCTGPDATQPTGEHVEAVARALLKVHAAGPFVEFDGDEHWNALDLADRVAWFAAAREAIRLGADPGRAR